MKSNHFPDIVWNEAAAEQVRQQTERAMNLEAQDIRDLAIRFHEQARQREEEIRRMEATLPIMMTITRRDSGGNPYEMSIENVAETQRVRANINNMRQQAAELRRAITRLNQAADELERMIQATRVMFYELHNLIFSTDQRHAARVRELEEKIRNYNQRIDAFRDSFDIGTLQSKMMPGQVIDTDKINYILDNKDGIATGSNYELDMYLAYVKARVAIGRISDFDTADVLGNALAVLPMEDRVNIKNMVVEAPPIPRFLMLTFAGYINIGSINDPRARFDPPYAGNDFLPTIHFDVVYDRGGLRGSYHVFFHEIAHMIDWAFGQHLNNYYTVAGSLAGKAFDALHLDVDTLLWDTARGMDVQTGTTYDLNSAFGRLRQNSLERRYRETAIDNILAGQRVVDDDIVELTPMEEFQLELQNTINNILHGRTDPARTQHNMLIVSNIFGGMTDNTVVGRWSHFRDPNYWFDDQGNPTRLQTTETFANVFSALMMGDQEMLDNAWDLLPNGMKVIEELLEHMYNEMRRGV